MRKGIEFNKAGFGRFGEEAYLRVKECGFDAVDFAMADTDDIYYTLPMEEACALLAHQKELAEAAGVSVHQVHGPWRWPPMDTTPEDRAERMEKMIRSIRMTKYLGAKNWVVHPIMPYTVEDLDNGMAEETWKLNIDFVQKLLAVAREEDVAICFENMPMLRFSLARPRDIMRVIDQMDDDHFVGCLDTGHVAVFPDEDIAEAVRTFGKKLRIMHVHDNSGRGDKHKHPYYGILDWKKYAAALKEIGFDGVFSLETLPSAKLPDSLFLEGAAHLAHIVDEILA